MGSKTIYIGAGIDIRRDENGVPHIEGDDLGRVCWGLGHCHALDRGLQLLTYRILGSGRVSELLDSSDESLEMDLFFRRMHWQPEAKEAPESLDPETRKLIDAYLDGIHSILSRQIPWELRVLGYRHEPWTFADSLLLSRMAGYLSLAQAQGEAERLLVEMVQGGIDRARLEELFPGLLGGLDEELLRKVTLGERIVPKGLVGNGAAPRFLASNNWVVSGSRTVSGSPLLANDPHLVGNYLPNPWYEVCLRWPGRYAAGATMPGLPGLLIGRTPDVAWGATYSFADCVDSWVEECRDGRHLREGSWVPFRTREEVIRRKGRAPERVTFHENDHGVLDGDPGQAGLYLATRWAGAEGGLRSMAEMLAMLSARSVREGMERLGRIETSWNWVLADRGGSIGYQLSGLVPKRRDGVSGMVPLPGWLAENDWQGYHEPQCLPRCVDPECGYIVTANQDLNALGEVSPILLPMGPYRARRIAELLESKERLDVEDMSRIQMDVHSLQADEFLEILGPLLPDTYQGRTLRDWNRQYDLESRGPHLFEALYRGLYDAVFGENGLGPRAVEHLRGETGLIADLYHNFDRILLSGSSSWFRGEERDVLYRRIIEEALKGPAELWKEHQTMRLEHILFGGKLPRFVGFDRGPIAVPGGRATPHQAQLFRRGGKLTSFVPSYRLVTDLGADELRTSLLGGVSDRRFSRLYCSELERWGKGACKLLRP